ncbi:MAG: ABC transporter permease [Fuscovulum sp.]|jgi:ribose transport system permease protein|nr:ABC transporter permease [Fuscovulum sp.]
MTSLRSLLAWHTMAPPLVFLAMVVVVGVFNANYLSPFGISIVAGTAAPILLVAVGQAMVLNIGSIDLSNAAISMLGAIMLALLVPQIGLAGILAVLVLMTVVGAINGAVLAHTQVPSFALTLGTLGILQTAALVISDSQTIYLSENRDLVTVLFNTNILFVPLTFWIGVLVAVAYWVLLRFTVAGQNMTAVGKNESGAILAAVPHKRVKIVSFAISGFTGALAGLCIVAQAGSASASGIGSNLLLPGIAAALVGGTSISGGLTNPLNVICGALTVAFVPVAIQALGFSPQAQSLVYGIFIILVVVLTTTRTRGLVIK